MMSYDDCCCCCCCEEPNPLVVQSGKSVIDAYLRTPMASGILDAEACLDVDDSDEKSIRIIRCLTPLRNVRTL